MKAQLAYLKYKLDSSFWFIPGLMIVASILLSFGMVKLDHLFIDLSINVSDTVYKATPDGARQLLTTIASSMITVTSLVFSMTLVALTLASQQLGPRLLENFMRDKGNQFVLGFFIATFVYALLVLRTISAIDDAHFVPSIAIAVAIVMSIVSFAILIYFIHHVSESIQADAVIAKVSMNLDDLIEAYFTDKEDAEDAPASGEVDDHQGKWPDDFEKNALAVCEDKSGYIQTLDIETLKSIATKNDLRIGLACRPGHFVISGTPLAFVSGEADVSDDVVSKIRSTFVFGPKRTPAQDVEYEIRVLAEIAVRALSPGINDHYTAITCVDRLAAALVAIQRCRIPGPDIADKSGKIILKSVPPDFDGMLDAAFNDIRQSAVKNTAVTIRLLESLTILAQQCKDRGYRQSIARHIDMVARAAEEFTVEPNDKSDVEERLKIARRYLQGDG